MKQEGIFTLSIDLELAWGRCDMPSIPKLDEQIREERAIVERILTLLEKYQIRATWAIVGHLLLKECTWENACVHPEIVRPVLKDEELDWFTKHPPAGDCGDPLWFGLDIINSIRQASPTQEIGSHSFCHMLYDVERTSRAAVQSDIFAASNLHRTNKLPFESFVFPRNVVGYTDMLAKAGVKCYRGKTRCWYDGIPNRAVRKLFHLSSYVLPTPPTMVMPMKDQNGLINIPESMLLMGRGGIRRLITTRNLIYKGISGLDKAVDRGKVFHLWFHPCNFNVKREEQFAVLEAILRHAQKLKKHGQLQNLSISDYARDVDKSEDKEVDLAIEKTRKDAVAFHEKNAGMFEELYERMRRDHHVSAFAYGRKRVEECLRDVLGTLPERGRILDIGCGTGDQLMLCRSLGFEVSGVEPSKRMREIARKQNPDTDILDGGIEALPYPDGHFDCVMAIEVLRYLRAKDIMNGYREVFRVLKPGGRFFFSMVNRYALDGFFLLDCIRKLMRRFCYKEALVHCEFTTPYEIRNDLGAFGVEEIEFCGRLILPLRVAYKLHNGFGVRVSRLLESLDCRLSQMKWTVPMAGHLIAIARRPALGTERHWVKETKSGEKAVSKLMEPISR